jgi:hypothetical protein
MINNNTNFDQLKVKTNWINWKAEKKIKNGVEKIDKIPVNIHGENIDATNSNNGYSYELVKESVGKNNITGIGIILDGTFGVIDLDNVIKDGKIIDEKAQKLLDKWNGFSEISPSGNGIHLFFLTNKIVRLNRMRYEGENGVKYECYTNKRFFTFTENQMETSKEIQSLNQKNLEDCLNILVDGWNKTNTIKIQNNNVNIQDITDEKVLERLLSKEKYRKIYLGDDTLKDGDTSSADMSLMTALQYYTAGNREQMKRVFANSHRGLRDKVSVRKDYLDRLVNDSISKYPCSSYYIWDKKENNTGEIFTLKDLLLEEDEVTKWIVEGLLVKGGISTLVAKPKVGKSCLVRQIALAISKGENFLGRNTRKGPVLYIALEEIKTEIKRHFIELGADGSENIEIYVGRTPENPIEWLTEKVEEYKPELVIIDTMGRFLGIKDINDYGKTTDALNNILYLAREQNTHITLLHHARKGEGTGGDTSLGSTAIFGSVDTSIFLNKTEGKRYISTEQRYGEDLESTLLCMNMDTKISTLGESKVDESKSNIKDEILFVLKNSPIELSEETINTKVKGRTVLKREALRELVLENKILKSGDGYKGSPFLYSCSR